jgi:hypothetical protein
VAGHQIAFGRQGIARLQTAVDDLIFQPACDLLIDLRPVDRLDRDDLAAGPPRQIDLTLDGLDGTLPG